MTTKKFIDFIKEQISEYIALGRDLDSCRETEKDIKEKLDKLQAKRKGVREVLYEEWIQECEGACIYIKIDKGTYQIEFNTNREVNITKIDIL